MVYFLVIDTVLFLSAWCKPKQSKILFGIAFFMLWFVMAFRNVNLGGSDAYVYQEWFYTTVPKLSQFEFNPFVFQRDIQAGWGFGWLFTLLASFIKTFAVNYIVFQVFYVTLSFLLLAMILHDMELTVQEKSLFMFAYLSQQMVWFFCVLLRQNLADLLVWYVLEHPFKKHEWLKKILILYAATLLHTSAYIAIAVVLALEIIKRFPIKKVVSGALLLGTILFFAGTKIISFILSFMAALDPRYGMYLESTGESSNVINFALRGCFLIRLYLEYRKHSTPEQREYLYIGAACFLTGSIPQALVVRMTEYFVIANHYSIAKFPELFDSKNRKIAAVICFGIFVVIFIRFLNGNAFFMKNYTFVFEI